MEFPLSLAIRYLRSKKRAFISVGTMFAIIGVTVGVAALTTVMSVTGGFRSEFRDKVLGVNAHVLVLKYSSDFSEYRDVMREMATIPGVVGVAPFVISPMMVTHGDRTATGVLLKGVDPERMASVLDLPRQISEPPQCRASGGNPQQCIDLLRLPDARPPDHRTGGHFDPPPTTPPPSSAKPLLDVIQERVASDAMAAAGAAAGARIASSAGSVPGELPPGSTVPEGGWTSRFLDEDIATMKLGPDIDPDPCADNARDRPLSGVIVGKALLEKLDLSIGDCLQVTSPTIGFTYTRGAIRAPVARHFRVVAAFDAGFDQYDSKLIYTDLFEAQKYLDGGDTVTGVEMKVSDIDRARVIKAAVDERLSNGLYNTMDWEELNHGLFTALRIQQIVMSMVLALIIVLAAFTVIATLIMLVLEKKREIAVLKAMGASDLKLLRAFLYQGGLIGLVGTVAGLGLGYLSCRVLLVYGFPLDPKVYFISRLPVQMHATEFALVGVFSLLVCLLATVWPALYAARLRPAEAFREQ
ncbi:MAG: ABC transporter permease [Polyangiaceae bacterium]|nr:ABC transporter permease [Polyangiaceae bacterium]